MNIDLEIQGREVMKNERLGHWSGTDMVDDWHAWLVMVVAWTVTI